MRLSNLPGTPSPRFFYGWWIVVACFGITAYLSGVIVYGFTALIEPLAEEFGWSYMQISIASSLRGIEIGVLAPLVGMLADRFGPRRILFVGGFITGLGLLLFSSIKTLSMLYVSFSIIAMGISALAPTVTMTAIGNWFHRRVGLAIGIAMTGWGAGALLTPLIVNLVDNLGWRDTMFWFAIGMWVVAIPLSLLVRHRPEQYGYLPDGVAAANDYHAESSPVIAETTPDATLRQAIKTRLFWHLALVLFCHEILVMATMTHLIPFLTSIRIPRAIGALYAIGVAVANTAGRLGFGWLGDRIAKKKVMLSCFILIGLGMLCFSIAGIVDPIWTTAWIVCFVIAYGSGYGGIYTMRGSAVYEAFGRRNFGVISGALTTIMLAGSFVGAPVAGWVFDTYGSYTPAWFGGLGISIVALIVILTMPKSFRGRAKISPEI